jgi:hypothetical protein
MSRAALTGVFIVLLTLSAHSQVQVRPPVGGVASPAEAMIFYAAHGPDGACGVNCAEWIAAEGVVEWDSFKRLFAFLARPGQHKMPVVVNSWADSDLKVAMTLGRIIRDHGLDVTAGRTVAADCAHANEAACFALKRAGKPLEAKIDASSVECDFACVLIPAGGVQRTLPESAKVLVGPVRIQNRVAPNVSEEQQKGLQSYFGDQFRLYLTQMGASPDIVDVLERSAATGKTLLIQRGDWMRLGIVAQPPQ